MQSTSTRLDGTVALVTGATGQLGRAFAIALADAGAAVAAVARREGELRQLASEHPQIEPYVCDLTDHQAAAETVARCVDRFGKVDVLVNNAGATNVTPAVEEDEQTFRRILEINLVAPFALTRLVAPAMLDRSSGSIINVASIVGLVGVGRMPQAAYAASKGGLVNLTRELAAQWARRGVRVNAIAPGFFRSDMTEQLFGSDKGRAWVAKLTPMGRGGELGELVGAVLYLADPANTYTTGITLPVDGGWTAT